MKRKRNKEEARRHGRRSLINLIGAVLLLLAGVLVALLFYAQSPDMQGWYTVYEDQLLELENSVLNLRNVWLILAVVLMLYIVKSVLSIFPTSVMCIITGAVLPMYMSFAINILGFILLVSLKYLWGRHLGGGNLQRLLRFNAEIRTFLERDGKGNPWLLFLFRVVPSFPVNAVSQIYGAMEFDYIDFVLISLLGFLPKLISYSIAGSYAFQPLSSQFLIPLVILFTLSGVSVIGVNLLLDSTIRRQQKEAAAAAPRKDSPKNNDERSPKRRHSSK
ncbi:MAG: VTT domain-containing protein [Oscillospiraceae bacterium]|nr:VTT domain-containing protein [Oscillospiraceae bacterium]